MTVDATASKSGSDGNPTGSSNSSSSNSSAGVTPPNNSYNSSQTVSVVRNLFHLNFLFYY
jgi:hypothetical protein